MFTLEMLISINEDEKITITICNSRECKIYLTEDGLCEELLQVNDID